jgi:hypothetical protein
MNSKGREGEENSATAGFFSPSLLCAHGGEPGTPQFTWWIRTPSELFSRDAESSDL